jgi:phage shock protein C
MSRRNRLQNPFDADERSETFGRRRNPHRLYRSDSPLLAGVAAGMAEYLGFNVLATRIAFAILSFPFPVIPIIYLVMFFVMKRRPQALYENPQDEAFWRTTTLAPSTSASEIRYRFRDMEDRVRSMEAYVTSAKYEFDRELQRGARTP